MKFYKALPYKIEHNGRTYRLDPAFDNVLTMFEATEGLLPHEVVDVALHFLIHGKHPNDPTLLKSVYDLLFDEKKKNDGQKRHYDFIQDSALIYAAFWQTYGIDLHRERGRMHWVTFATLFAGLPSDTRFSEVVQIRLRPLPKATKYNAEERGQLIRLKQEVALKISEEERQANLQAGFSKMAMTLMAMAERNKNKGESVNVAE